MTTVSKPSGLLDGPTEPPRLPVRAAIYIDRDGTVHFGALFADLVPVARAQGHPGESSALAPALPAAEPVVAPARRAAEGQGRPVR